MMQQEAIFLAGTLWNTEQQKLFHPKWPIINAMIPHYFAPN
jgi:hypothetical protein